MLPLYHYLPLFSHWVISDSAIPWGILWQFPLSFSISQSLLKFMSIEWWCYLTISSSATPFSFCLQSFQATRSFPVSQLFIRWPNYWSFSFSISSSNKYSGLISSRIDCFDLAVQGTLKSLLQHHSWKASVLQCSAFIMVQLLHPNMTAGKNHNWLDRPLSAI